MQRCLYWISAAALALTTTARAVEQTITLKEWLDRGWARELLTYPFEAPEGTCHPQGLTLTGPDGPVPVQLHRVTTWPDGRSVKTAEVWFVADLSARATDVYSLHGQAEPAPVPETDLHVADEGDHVQITTSEFGARFFAGQVAYDTPQPAGAVPPPLAAMRLRDGTWFGGSELFGDAKVVAASGRLTAAGPVFAEMTFQYDYADGNRLALTARLAAGDNAVAWDMDVRQDNPGSGWRINLNKGLPELFFPVEIENSSTRDCVKRGERGPFRWHQPIRNLCVLPLATHPSGLICSMTPWQDWWSDYTKRYLWLWIPDKRMQLSLARVDAGAWVKPAPPGTMQNSGVIQPKMIPLIRTAQGAVVFEANLAAGEPGGIRRWTLGASPLPDGVAAAPDILELMDAGILTTGGACPRIGRRLNVVKDYILEWPRDPASPHPRLFLSAAELEALRGRIEPAVLAPDVLKRVAAGADGPVGKRPESMDGDALAAWLLTGDPQWAAKGKLVERMKTRLASLGGFDKMRHTLAVLTLYDGVIDSELIRDEDRPYLRAQMAYLAYEVHSPETWSIERGYKSGNPNMSISHMINRGCVAALLRDHPMSKEWMESPVQWLDKWLSDDIGPRGEWRESHHYTHVSFDGVMAFVVAAKASGHHDFFAHGNLKKLFLYIGKMLYTPPDPMRGNRRVTAPMGRRPSGADWALTGFAAKATAASDPEFSKAMQFIWQGTGFSRHITDSRWGGFENVYLDPTLPAAKPEWDSERFPWWGAVMHQGYGTDQEGYVNVLLPGHGWMSPGARGSVVKYFSMGVPIGGAFAGTYDVTPNMGVRQELMQNAVVLARDWTDLKDWFVGFGRSIALKAADFAAQPRLDYLRADMRIGEREALWGDKENLGMKLPLDLVPWPPVARRGKPPVDWTRQLLFVKSATPAEPGYLVFRDTIAQDEPTMWQFWTLSRKIGAPEQTADLETFLADEPGNSVQPHRALEGNRFTAIGQFGVDTEYYIASPSDTPRFTLRYGCATPRKGKVQEYQDLLMIRQESAGDYYVVVYPRRREAPAPTFARAGEGGHIIAVSDEQGADWCFLAAEPTEAATGEVAFRGTAGCVQDHGGSVSMDLAAPGSVRYGALGVEAEHPANLVREADVIRLRVPAGHATGGRLRLTLAGDWTLADPAATRAELSREPDGYLVVLPPGVTQAVLTLNRQT